MQGPKSEVPTLGLVAPSVFIQIDWNNAGNYFLVCRFQIFWQKNVIFEIFFGEFIKKNTYESIALKHVEEDYAW